MFVLRHESIFLWRRLGKQGLEFPGPFLMSRIICIDFELFLSPVVELKLNLLSFLWHCKLYLFKQFHFTLSSSSFFFLMANMVDKKITLSCYNDSSPERFICYAHSDLCLIFHAVIDHYQKPRLGVVSTVYWSQPRRIPLLSLTDMSWKPFSFWRSSLGTHDSIPFYLQAVILFPCSSKCSFKCVWYLPCFSSIRMDCHCVCLGRPPVLLWVLLLSI